jgi:hypothetical protein
VEYQLCISSFSFLGIHCIPDRCVVLLSHLGWQRSLQGWKGPETCAAALARGGMLCTKNIRVCLVRGMGWSIVFSFLTFCIWFVEWNELIHHQLIPHKITISICMRNELVPLKFMEWTHDAPPHDVWGDSTNQTHPKCLHKYNAGQIMPLSSQKLHFDPFLNVRLTLDIGMATTCTSTTTAGSTARASSHSSIGTHTHTHRAKVMCLNQWTT